MRCREGHRGVTAGRGSREGNLTVGNVQKGKRANPLTYPQHFGSLVSSTACAILSLVANSTSSALGLSPPLSFLL